MAKKKLVVSDILNAMEDNQKVICSFTAYGVGYANSWRDGMRTVSDCKDRLRYDCTNAVVTGVGYAVISDPDVPSRIVTEIYAEIVH